MQYVGNMKCSPLRNSNEEKKIVPVKMAAYVNVILASSHNHFKITTKPQNNHHSKLPEM